MTWTMIFLDFFSNCQCSHFVRNNFYFTGGLYEQKSLLFFGRKSTCISWTLADPCHPKNGWSQLYLGIFHSGWWWLLLWILTHRRPKRMKMSSAVWRCCLSLNTHSRTRHFQLACRKSVKNFGNREWRRKTPSKGDKYEQCIYQNYGFK